jgi:sorting nexin-1/2/sorting nexin-4
MTSSELGAGITLGIVGHEQRGSAFMKYTVYHICGEDRKGTIDVYRRFNEFYKMRVAITKRFPGCFVPSIPDKTLTLKDDELVRKRQRYLNDFVRKMTKLPHLYGSEEFQALLRSTEKDLSATFEKWPNPTTA